jgi:hypothetical protein
MIIIVSDKMYSWLKYIWEEFSRIQGLKDRFSFLTLAEYGARANWDAKLVIEYGSQQQIVGSLFVPDLLYNAFVSLSRLEEWQSETQGRLIHSYASRLPNKGKKDWSTPVVNHLFQELEDRIQQEAPQVVFGNSKKPVIEYSHDVDYISKTPQLRLKQTAFNFYKATKKFPHVSQMTRQAGKILTFLLSTPSYWCFEDWKELENKYDQRSVFYLHAHTGYRGCKSWLIDPSYDIARNQKLQDQLKNLLDEGFEVGLHGSTNSAADGNQLAVEKEALEKALDISVIKTRQHWLNYRESVTPGLHEKLFQYDSTLGWNDQMGFRAGSASRYRPYDHVNQMAFNYFETPLVLMDSTIYDYNHNRIPEAKSEAVEMLNSIKNLKNVHVSVCWHQRGLSRDYGWQESYENCLLS